MAHTPSYPLPRTIIVPSHSPLEEWMNVEDEDASQSHENSRRISQNLDCGMIRLPEIPIMTKETVTEQGTITLESPPLITKQLKKSPIVLSTQPRIIIPTQKDDSFEESLLEVKESPHNLINPIEHIENHIMQNIHSYKIPTHSSNPVSSAYTPPLDFHAPIYPTISITLPSIGIDRHRACHDDIVFGPSARQLCKDIIPPRKRKRKRNASETSLPDLHKIHRETGTDTASEVTVPKTIANRREIICAIAALFKRRVKKAWISTSSRAAEARGDLKRQYLHGVSDSVMDTRCTHDDVLAIRSIAFVQSPAVFPYQPIDVESDLGQAMLLEAQCQLENRFEAPSRSRQSKSYNKKLHVVEANYSDDDIQFNDSSVDTSPATSSVSSGPPTPPMYIQPRIRRRSSAFLPIPPDPLPAWRKELESVLETAERRGSLTEIPIKPFHESLNDVLQVAERGGSFSKLELPFCTLPALQFGRKDSQPPLHTFRPDQTPTFSVMDRGDCAYNKTSGNIASRQRSDSSYSISMPQFDPYRTDSVVATSLSTNLYHHDLTTPSLNRGTSPSPGVLKTDILLQGSHNILPSHWSPPGTLASAFGADTVRR